VNIYFSSELSKKRAESNALSASLDEVSRFLTSKHSASLSKMVRISVHVVYLRIIYCTVTGLCFSLTDPTVFVRAVLECAISTFVISSITFRLSQNSAKEKVC